MSLTNNHLECTCPSCVEIVDSQFHIRVGYRSSYCVHVYMLKLEIGWCNCRCCLCQVESSAVCGERQPKPFCNNNQTQLPGRTGSWSMMETCSLKLRFFFISSAGSLNCSAFMAGIIEAFLNGTQFVSHTATGNISNGTRDVFRLRHNWTCTEYYGM